ncbi:hypothetical protein HHI36_015446 [Cryptolaemus montrouzieri]|uniref:Uncharacterized protein n=1 Tax=Cryptolaemus montrouzieri TaxID=559131 RepID=A0ABD2N5X4_9CUCU
MPLSPFSTSQRIISMCAVSAPPSRNVVTQNSCLRSRPDTIIMEVDENVPPYRVGSTLLTDISYNSPDLRYFNSFNEDASAYLGDVISQDLGLMGIAMEEEIKMTKKNSDSEFVENTDKYTDENIDEDIEE